MPVLQIQMMDHFAARVDGLLVPEEAWRGTQSRSLLQFLATRPGYKATSDELISTLWSHLPVEQARHNLHVTVSRLRRALAATHATGATATPQAVETYVLASRTGYRLAEGTQVDLQSFHEFVQDLQRLQLQDRTTALSMIHDGTWTRTLDLEVDQPYADWACEIRERLRRDFISWHVIRADLLLWGGQSARALEALLRALDLEPSLESAVQQAMLIAYNLGNQVLALNIFDRCRRFLLEELGISPLPETMALYSCIINHQVATLNAIQTA